MKKYLFTMLSLCHLSSAFSQTTTIAGAVTANGLYTSDYSPDSTLVSASGSVSLVNGSTWEHGSKNFRNNGAWVSTTGSTDLFLGTIGSGTNTIAGTAALSFYNVNFNIGSTAAMNITNTAGISIGGNLAFNNGTTTTVRANTIAGAVVFQSGATYTGSVGNSLGFTNSTADAQNVDGYISKIGNTAFVYPIGSGADARPLQVAASSNAATTQIAAAWIAGDPTTVADPSDPSASALHPITSYGSGIGGVSSTGQWDWIPTVAPTTAVTVTVSVPDVSSFSSAANLRLVGWNGTQWVDLSGTAAVANASGNTENSTLTGIVPAGSTITAIGIGAATVADLTARVTLNPTNVIGSTTMQVTVQVSEINGVASNGTITMYVDKYSNFSNFNFNSAATTNLAGQTLKNNLFTIDATSNPSYYIITTSSLVLNNSLARLMFSVTLAPGSNKGSETVSVLLDAASGGQTNTNNDIGTSTVTYSY